MYREEDWFLQDDKGFRNPGIEYRTVETLELSVLEKCVNFLPFSCKNWS